MFLLLLLPLLSESLADKACINISNGDIATSLTLSGNDLSFKDDRLMSISCMYDGIPCVIWCPEPNNNLSQIFNGTYMCQDVKILSSSNTTEFSIHTVGQCTLSKCKVNEILPMVDKLACPQADLRSLMQLLFIRDSCKILFRDSDEMKKAFINIERFLIHKIMQRTQQEVGKSTYYYFKTMALNVISISNDNLSSATIDTIQLESPQLLPQNMSSVPETWLPVDTLEHILQENRTVGLVSYMFHDQFQFGMVHISSMAMRIELLGEKRLENLTTPLKLIFNITAPTNIDNESWLECHYFDEQEFHWKTDGCETYSATYDNHTEIECCCNHTTPFAVLLMREPISGVHWKILSYISYIGCGLSAFFSALSVITYIINRSHRADQSCFIHVSLSGALFLLNTSFLLTEWGATVQQDGVCVFIAATMHYSLLCCFTWMAIEALHLYLLLVKVFNTYYKRYLIKLSLAGWGIPAVIVGIFVGVNDIRQFYGVAKMSMLDTNQTSNLCWITDEHFFYGLNLVYFTLIFIFNTGILGTVVAGICRLREGSKHTPGRSKGSLSCRNSLTVMGLTCLLGTTWGLVFLGSGHVNYPVLYLFCILNSTQGFFIFLWICCSARKQRRRAEQDNINSVQMKSSQIKSI
ncbi:adhesion G-protein coupled receptor G2-like isoform X2 [Myripristis murdjan]|nr:adhesion G-protein coupled receptor G2-like isoform X2 [Myripristis murdjan]